MEYDNQNEDYEEDIVSEDEAENPGALIKKLRQKLKDSEKEKQEYLDGWQRTKADFVNARKNEEKEKEEFVKFATQKIVSEILPVLDNFESALASSEKENSSWQKGVENIYKDLKKILIQNGVEEIDPKVDSDFDPNVHEAVSLEKVEDKNQDHKVIGVAQKGYKLNGRVVRAAKVRVGEYEGK